MGIDYSLEVPFLTDIDRDEAKATTYFEGGESKALEIMENYLKDKKRVQQFSKPCTLPTSLKPNTTALSPYLKFGCLSVRLFYEKLRKI